MEPKIHYVVRHAKLVTNNEGEIAIEVFTNRAFQHERPIMARQEAFSYYQTYQAGVDEYSELGIEEKQPKSKENTETRQAMVQEDLAAFRDFMASYNPSPWHIWALEDPEKADKVTPYGDAVVILVRDVNLLDAEGDEAELVIHRTIKLDAEDPHVVSTGYDVDELMQNLDTEYILYQKLGYNTAGQSTKVYYWDSERYYEGLPQENWADWHTILKTPFDWTPYEKENWWNDPEFFENRQQRLLDEKIESYFAQDKELIKNGESKTVEFKTLMFAEITTTDKEGKSKIRNMRLEVAETICSFLNTHGGNIYIGVKDDGRVVGVDFEGKTQDQYKRSFTKLREDFFSHHSSVVYSLVSGSVIEIEGKKIFRIRVKESEEEPIYLYNKMKPFGTAYQFFVRQEASSNVLYDPPRLVRYIEDKWWRKKYQQS